MSRRTHTFRIAVLQRRKNSTLSTTLIFFHLADDAPYSMKDFQLARGDVDIEYGPWTQAAEGASLRSYKPPGKGIYGEPTRRV